MTAQTLTPSKHFVIERLAEGVFAAIARDGGALIANAGIVDLGGWSLVFDTGLTPQAGADLRRAAEALTGQPPKMVVNSHYHNDHVWGNQAFGPETIVAATAATRRLLATAGVEEVDDAKAGAAGRHAALLARLDSAVDPLERRRLVQWIGYFGGMREALPALSVRFPDLTFESELELHGARGPAQFSTFERAHSGADTILHLPEQGIVFAADLLFTGSHPYLADGDAGNALNALRALGRMKAARIVPGHGPVGGQAEIQTQIDYIEGCLETAERLTRAGEDPGGQPVPERYRAWDFPQFYAANLRFLCSQLSAKTP